MAIRRGAAFAAALALLLAACGDDDGGGLRIRFHGAVAEERADELRAEARRVAAFYAERFGIASLDVVIHASADLESHTDAVHGMGAVGSGRYPCLAVPGAVFLQLDEDCASPERLGGMLAHEYFHALQFSLARAEEASDLGPIWLTEGTAIWILETYGGGSGPTTFDGPTALYESEITLANAEFQFHPLGRLGVETYMLGWLAALELAERASEESLLDYYRLLPERDGWRDAFRDAFGMSVGELTAAVGERRAELVAEATAAFDAIRGTVSGPDGEGVSGVVLRAWRGEPGASVYAHARLSGHAAPEAGGAFRLPVAEPASYLVTVHRPAADGCRLLGWYARDTGFTTDHRDASPVVVASGAAAAVAIRLPGIPDAIPHVGEGPPRCAR